MPVISPLGTSTFAVPVPEPTPVAVNTSPTLLLAAPINVKSVVPTDTILYSLPMLNNPAVNVPSNVAVAVAGLPMPVVASTFSGGPTTTVTAPSTYPEPPSTTVIALIGPLICATAVA